MGAALPPNNSNMIDIGPAEDWKPPVAATPPVVVPQLNSKPYFNSNPVAPLPTNTIHPQAPVVKSEPVVPATLAAPPAAAIKACLGLNFPVVIP